MQSFFGREIIYQKEIEKNASTKILPFWYDISLKNALNEPQFNYTGMPWHFYAGFTCKMNDLAGSFIRKGFSSSVKGTKDT